jgi:hypothetical protein
MIIMLVHTSLSAAEFRGLTRTAPGVYFHHLAEKGSQSHPRAFKIVLSGTSPRRGQATIGDSEYYAATWDQWGIVLGALFAIDPSARVPGVYADGGDFHWQTGGRFNGKGELTPCPQHRWVSAPTGRESRCTLCPAVKRWQR